MRTAAALLLLSAVTLGCGAPAIVDASRSIASARGCEPAELTVVEVPAGYEVRGCGEPAVFDCSSGTCQPESAPASPGGERLDAAAASLRAIEPRALTCLPDAQPIAAQVQFDASGAPQSLDTHPPVDAETRACIGRLVLDSVAAPPGERALLVSHTFGGAPEPEPETTRSAAGDAGGEVTERSGNEGAEQPPLQTTACSGTVDPTAARAAVGALRRELRGCYEAAMRQDPALAERQEVRVRVSFRARGDGTVDEIQVEPSEPAQMAECLEAAVSGIEPPAIEGDCAVIAAPFRFRPTDPSPTDPSPTDPSPTDPSPTDASE